MDYDISKRQASTAILLLILGAVAVFGHQTLSTPVDPQVHEGSFSVVSQSNQLATAGEVACSADSDCPETTCSGDSYFVDQSGDRYCSGGECAGYDKKYASAEYCGGMYDYQCSSSGCDGYNDGDDDDSGDSSNDEDSTDETDDSEPDEPPTLTDTEVPDELQPGEDFEYSFTAWRENRNDEMDEMTVSGDASAEAYCSGASCTIEGPSTAPVEGSWDVTVTMRDTAGRESTEDVSVPVDEYEQVTVWVQDSGACVEQVYREDRVPSDSFDSEQNCERELPDDGDSGDGDGSDGGQSIVDRAIGGLRSVYTGILNLFS